MVILRLTLLAPDIVEAILDGRQPRTLQLADLMDDMPVEWERQRKIFMAQPPDVHTASTSDADP